MFQSLYECSSRSSHLKNGVKEGVLKVTYVAGDTTLWGGRSFDGCARFMKRSAQDMRRAAVQVANWKSIPLLSLDGYPAVSSTVE
jgi:hypothetical protein